MPDRARATGGRPAGAVATIVRKELREIARDGRFWTVGAIVGALFLAALGFGWQKARAAEAERTAAQAVADSQWREQDDKNPHVAAHYGTYVFKPTGTLPFLDPGIDPFVGVSVKLEAHKQNALQGAGAQDGTALQRFGRLSVASVLQLLLPLLVIGVGFAAWSGERERGTLRQLASLGVAARTLLAGKAIGLVTAIGALVVPALLLGAVGVVALGGTSAGAESASGRLAWLVGCYAVYLLVYVAVTLFTSAVAPSSRFALVALMGFWVLSGLVVPRVAHDVVSRLARPPTHVEVGRQVRASMEAGLPGGPPREERVTAITEGLLERQGFKGAETLMDASLLQGIELQAEALFENEVLDHHFGRFHDAVERHERLTQWAGVVAPLVALQSVSMALAGTDYAHHRHFTEAAERHRRALVELLNREFAERGGSDAWSYKAGRELWEKAPKFVYRQPALGWVLGRQAVSLGILAGWLALASVAAWLAVARIKVV
jgi:ABC-2 type transport system permease protein